MPFNAEEYTLAALQDHLDRPMRAVDIMREAREEYGDDIARSVINRALYALEKRNLACRDNSTPPRWSVLKDAAREAKSEVTSGKPVVFVDLGNVHDVARHLEPLAADGHVEVYLFADLQYAGYPIGASVAHLPVKRAKTGHSNAADFWLIWTLRDLVEEVRAGTRAPLELIVCTKDQGIHCIRELVDDEANQAFFRSVTFVNNWESLEPHVS